MLFTHPSHAHLTERLCSSSIQSTTQVGNVTWSVFVCCIFPCILHVCAECFKNPSGSLPIEFQWLAAKRDHNRSANHPQACGYIPKHTLIETRVWEWKRKSKQWHCCSIYLHPVIRWEGQCPSIGPTGPVHEDKASFFHSPVWKQSQ